MSTDQFWLGIGITNVVVGAVLLNNCMRSGSYLGACFAVLLALTGGVGVAYNLTEIAAALN